MICDADVCEHAGWTLVDYASACLDAGARILQVRAKHAPSGWLLDSTARIVELAGAADGAEVIVNDRADIARLSGASGVHVGQDDLSPRDVRKIAGNQCVVGMSTHTAQQVDEALLEPVSHIAIGPVFGTTTKDTGHAALGLERLQQLSDRVTRQGLPVVAIGGMTLERAPAVMKHGASALAVIGDLLATGDPAARVRAYLQILSRV